ncbi:MAG TPA: hypothetical protein VFH92_10645 [Phenylobacterium sp.]|nr:hypothetical protein [Phenylobacterium sp.]
MSSVSQTPARAASGFPTRFALSTAAVAAIVGVSLSGAWKVVGRIALTAHPHAPDLALFERLPLAIKIHLLAAVAALVLGGVLMTMRKGRTFHRVAGWVWVSLVSTVAGASIFITSLNHGHWSILHLFTGWTLLVLPLAVMWARRHDVARHRRTMMGLFYGGFAVNLLIAFIPGRTLWMMFMG